MMKPNIGATVELRSDLARTVNFRSLCVCCCAIVLLVTLARAPAQAAEIDLETRAELQLALKQYIDAGTAGGVYEHFNVERGAVEKLRLKTLHPVIFVVESKYMLCADFLDVNGKAVMLDYVVGSSATGFRIEQAIAGQRSYLTRIFERID